MPTTEMAMEPKPASPDLVVICNRLPIRLVRGKSGETWARSPGGLVSAMTPVLSRRGGLWIGWPGAEGQQPPPSHDGVHIIPVSLSRSQIAGYYHELSNGTLWPLYHDALRSAEFDSEHWRTYRQVNELFAATAARRAPRGATVWVHDYQLHLVPQLLRRRRPDLDIGFFLHIPFPPAELFAQLPWREDLLRGLLGADLVGFHTESYTANFVAACQRLLGVRVSGGVLQVDGRRVNVGAFPISIDFQDFDRRARDPGAKRRVTRLRHRLGSGRKVILGVDRLDYTKGIEHRLRAYLRLLDEGLVQAEDCVMVQIAVPSREQIRSYAEQRARIERLVGEINGRFGEPGLDAVCYQYRSVPLERLVAYYGAADVMAVTSLRDGMNLVAKEFAASRPDERGVLLLSEFTGAAERLRGVTLVNPYDIEGLGAGLISALTRAPERMVADMRELRQCVRDYDVYRWATDFLGALERRDGRVRAGSLNVDMGLVSTS